MYVQRRAIILSGLEIGAVALAPLRATSACNNNSGGELAIVRACSLLKGPLLVPPLSAVCCSHIVSLVRSVLFYDCTDIA